MKSPEIFGLIVRTVGLAGLAHLVATGISTLGAILSGAWPLLLYLVLEAAICLWLIRGAPQLVRFAYPPESGR